MQQNIIVYIGQARIQEKKWTSSKFPGFPILSNISPIFPRRFASANVTVNLRLYRPPLLIDWLIDNDILSDQTNINTIVDEFYATQQT